MGSNETAAKLSGIRVNWVKTFVFMITGLLSGISAFLPASRLTSITAPNAGMSLELNAIAAVAIGGTAMSGLGLVESSVFLNRMIEDLELHMGTLNERSCRSLCSLFNVIELIVFRTFPVA